MDSTTKSWRSATVQSDNLDKVRLVSSRRGGDGEPPSAVAAGPRGSARLGRMVERLCEDRKPKWMESDQPTPRFQGINTKHRSLPTCSCLTHHVSTSCLCPSTQLGHAAQVATGGPESVKEISRSRCSTLLLSAACMILKQSALVESDQWTEEG